MGRGGDDDDDDGDDDGGSRGARTPELASNTPTRTPYTHKRQTHKRQTQRDGSEGYAWAEDKEHCEEYGRMLNADPSKVSARAKKRGLPQMGTLGAGNHCEPSCRLQRACCC